MPQFLVAGRDELVTRNRGGDAPSLRPCRLVTLCRMSDTVFDRIERLLTGTQAAYQVLRHAPVLTSAEAAAIRGTSLASGAKALVCKADNRFHMIVLPADRKLDGKRTRAERGWKGLRFATAEEVLRLTGLTPGSIPPFGSLFDLPTWCDHALGESPTINFNAGDHAISISMAHSDYLRVEQPDLGYFS
jgi:Ala-tRNA(Pro) deacylase